MSWVWRSCAIKDTLSANLSHKAWLYSFTLIQTQLMIGSYNLAENAIHQK